MSSEDYGTSRGAQTLVYFENADDAEMARQDLIESGTPAGAMHLESKDSGTGFFESVKRAFMGTDSEYEGSVLAIDNQYAGQNCLTAVRGRGGRIAESERVEGDETERRMPLHEEQVSIQKQPVESGEAVVRKDVVTETQHIDVPVRHEEVYVEQRSSSGSEAAAGAIDEDEEIRIPVMKEEVDVQKRTVKTGEVAVGKRTVQDTQSVDETIRKEKARVDTTGDVRTRQS